MATLQAVAAKRQNALDRLSVVMSKVSELTGVEPVSLTIKTNDMATLQAHQLDQLATWGEALVEHFTPSEDPAQYDALTKQQIIEELEKRGIDPASAIPTGNNGSVIKADLIKLLADDDAKGE